MVLCSKQCLTAESTINMSPDEQAQRADSLYEEAVSLIYPSDGKHDMARAEALLIEAFNLGSMKAHQAWHLLHSHAGKKR